MIIMPIVGWWASTIGQLDSDPELEIGIGGYSSSARNIYDNPDSSFRFPVDVDEDI